jgi:prepilin-type N-terminal cleavage/methylation domain-containing protein
MISALLMTRTGKNQRAELFLPGAEQSAAAADSLVATPSRYPDVAGFTLLELAVVLLLIGLIMAIAMPRFGALQATRLRSESRRLATWSHYLFEEAEANKVLLRLNIDLTHNTYFVTRLDPSSSRPGFVPERGLAAGVVTLPADVRLRDAWIEGAGLFRRGIAGCQFYPGGAADAAVVHLVDRNGDVMTVAIKPFDGAAAIFRGDVDPILVQRIVQQ